MAKEAIIKYSDGRKDDKVEGDTVKVGQVLEEEKGSKFYEGDLRIFDREKLLESGHTYLVEVAAKDPGMILNRAYFVCFA